MIHALQIHVKRVDKYSQRFPIVIVSSASTLEKIFCFRSMRWFKTYLPDSIRWMKTAHLQRLKIDKRRNIFQLKLIELYSKYMNYSILKNGKWRVFRTLAFVEVPSILIICFLIVHCIREAIADKKKYLSVENLYNINSKLLSSLLHYIIII